MGYNDKTWYVGRSALKYYPCLCSVVEAHVIKVPHKFANSHKGSPCCVSVYSVNIVSM